MNKELNIFLDELEKIINKSFKKVDTKITAEDIKEVINKTKENIKKYLLTINHK